MRTELLRARLSALITESATSEEFSAAVCDLLGQAVPFDYACLATTDPSTGLITGVVKTDSGDSADEEFARYEFGLPDDYLLFADMARRSVPVAVLHTETSGQPERSRHFREFLRPRFSHGHEWRAVFRAGGQMWGAAGLYRSTGPGGSPRPKPIWSRPSANSLRSDSASRWSGARCRCRPRSRGRRRSSSVRTTSFDQ